MFDALTSSRPYTLAWSHTQAFDLLRRGAGRVYDAECVAALAEDPDAVTEIPSEFAEPMID